MVQGAHAVSLAVAADGVVAALAELTPHLRIGLLAAALGREAVATGQPAMVLALAHEIARKTAGINANG